MKVEPAFVGARGIDSLEFSRSGTASQASALATSGIDFVFGYLGAISPQRLKYVLDAGMAFMPVTFGAHYDGVQAVSFCNALGLPKTTTVWLDHEGQAAFDTPPDIMKRKIIGWCAPVKGAGYMPAGYIGVPQPLTSEELWELPLERYWRGQGSIRDRNDLLAEPVIVGPHVDRDGKLVEPVGCGWCVTQMYPSRTWGGVLVDVDMVGQDYKGRVPNWVRG